MTEKNTLFRWVASRKAEAHAVARIILDGRSHSPRYTGKSQREEVPLRGRVGRGIWIWSVNVWARNGWIIAGGVTDTRRVAGAIPCVPYLLIDSL